MGVLAYNPNIDVRLSHLRRDQVFSLMDLCELADNGYINQAKAKIAEFKKQSSLKTGIDNMVLIQAAANYEKLTRDVFNFATKIKVLLGHGMNLVVGEDQNLKKSQQQKRCCC
jgi:hypothetical protein